MKKWKLDLIFACIPIGLIVISYFLRSAIVDEVGSFIVTIVSLLLLITTIVLGAIIPKKYGKEESDNSLSEAEKQAIIKRNKKFAIIGISIGLVTFIAFLIYVFMQI